MTKRGAEPDWNKLNELADRCQALIAAGQMTRAAYNEIFAEGKAAVHGHDEFLEGLLRYRPDGFGNVRGDGDAGLAAALMLEHPDEDEPESTWLKADE